MQDMKRIRFSRTELMVSEIAFGIPLTAYFLKVCYNCFMDYKDRIVIDAAKRSGKPCIRNTRITVYDVLEYLAGGMTVERIIEDFPELEKADIFAVLAFAADKERKLSILTA